MGKVKDQTSCRVKVQLRMKELVLQVVHTRSASLSSRVVHRFNREKHIFHFEFQSKGFVLGMFLKLSLLI